jgi:hypothetical protein
MSEQHNIKLSLCAMGLVALFCVNAVATTIEPPPKKSCQAKGWVDNRVKDYECRGQGLRMVFADSQGRCTRDVENISCVKCVATSSNLCVDQKTGGAARTDIPEGFPLPLPPPSAPGEPNIQR